jgi:hypothetical protein
MQYIKPRLGSSCSGLLAAVIWLQFLACHTAPAQKGTVPSRLHWFDAAIYSTNTSRNFNYSLQNNEIVRCSYFSSSLRDTIKFLDQNIGPALRNGFVDCDQLDTINKKSKHFFLLSDSSSMSNQQFSSSGKVMLVTSHYDHTIHSQNKEPKHISSEFRLHLIKNDQLQFEVRVAKLGGRFQNFITAPNNNGSILLFISGDDRITVKTLTDSLILPANYIYQLSIDSNGKEIDSVRLNSNLFPLEQILISAWSADELTYLLTSEDVGAYQENYLLHYRTHYRLCAIGKNAVLKWNIDLEGINSGVVEGKVGGNGELYLGLTSEKGFSINQKKVAMNVSRQFVSELFCVESSGKSRFFVELVNDNQPVMFGTMTLNSDGSHMFCPCIAVDTSDSYENSRDKNHQLSEQTGLVIYNIDVLSGVYTKEFILRRCLVSRVFDLNYALNNKYFLSAEFVLAPQDVQEPIKTFMNQFKRPQTLMLAGTFEIN